MVFKTMDINQDGRITKEELATIFSSKNTDNLEPEYKM